MPKCPAGRKGGESPEKGGNSELEWHFKQRSRSRGGPNANELKLLAARGRMSNLIAEQIAR